MNETYIVLHCFYAGSSIVEALLDLFISGISIHGPDPMYVTHNRKLRSSNNEHLNYLFK